MSIDHGKLLALADRLDNGEVTKYDAAEELRALAQPAEAVEDDHWSMAAQAAVSHLDYETDAPQAVKAALRQLSAALNGTPAHDAAQGAVAWYVFADTEKWVTLDRSEADDNRAEGCQVRPLIFGDTHPQAAPAQGDGWKLVPVNATEAMEDAALVWMTGFQHMRKQDRRNAMANAYAAMLAAAPSQEGES